MLANEVAQYFEKFGIIPFKVKIAKKAERYVLRFGAVESPACCKQIKEIRQHFRKKNIKYYCKNFQNINEIFQSKTSFQGLEEVISKSPSQVFIQIEYNPNLFDCPIVSLRFAKKVFYIDVAQVSCEENTCEEIACQMFNNIASSIAGFSEFVSMVQNFKKSSKENNQKIQTAWKRFTLQLNAHFNLCFLI